MSENDPYGLHGKSEEELKKFFYAAFRQVRAGTLLQWGEGGGKRWAAGHASAPQHRRLRKEVERRCASLASLSDMKTLFKDGIDFYNVIEPGADQDAEGEAAKWWKKLWRQEIKHFGWDTVDDEWDGPAAQQEFCDTIGMDLDEIIYDASYVSAFAFFASRTTREPRSKKSR